MTLTLHKTFKKDKIGLHACLYLVYINLKHSQSSVYLGLLIAYGTPTKRIEYTIFYWANLEINSRAQVTCANKPVMYMHIPVKVKSVRE